MNEKAKKAPGMLKPLWDLDLGGSEVCWGRSRSKANKRSQISSYRISYAGPPRLKVKVVGGHPKSIPTKPWHCFGSQRNSANNWLPLSTGTTVSQCCPPWPLRSPWGHVGIGPEASGPELGGLPSSPGTGQTCLPCFMMVGLAVVLRWVELTNPLVPRRPRRAEGTFREGIWYWRGFRRPIPPPTEPAVGRELDCPKPRL